MRRLIHLARRFLQSLRARLLSPDEQEQAREWLDGHGGDLFWRQQPLDQRHGLECAAHIEERSPARADLIRAALLHDVGKRHAALGVPGRVIAGALGFLRLPAPGRLGRHLAHGVLGADDLTGTGAETIVAAFAAGHHTAAAPDGVDPGDWALLREADGE